MTKKYDRAAKVTAPLGLLLIVVSLGGAGLSRPGAGAGAWPSRGSLRMGL
jgi:hypothetical protein